MSLLYIVSGIPGSGKSTFLKELAAIDDVRPFVVVSSDRLRACFGKGEHDQSVSPVVFPFMERMVDYLLQEGYNVAVDATNTTIRARAPFVAIGRKHSARIIAKVMKVDLETAWKRNCARPRVVPREVLERMFRQFEMPTVGEVDLLDVL